MILIVKRSISLFVVQEFREVSPDNLRLAHELASVLQTQTSYPHTVLVSTDNVDNVVFVDSIKNAPSIDEAESV